MGVKFQNIIDITPGQDATSGPTAERIIEAYRKLSGSSEVLGAVSEEWYESEKEEYQNRVEKFHDYGYILDKEVNYPYALRDFYTQFLVNNDDLNTAARTQYTYDERYIAVGFKSTDEALAREIARESITLLKNEDGLLPLKKRTATIAVLGPGAGEAALGDYTPYGKTGVSILEGIRSLVPEDTRILYDKGCTFLGDTAKPFEPGMLTDEDGNPGLTGRYYNGRTPAGEPVVIRNDPTIHFNWIFAKPHPDLDANCYSVVWTGYVTMPSSFQGCIGFSTQDSMRLYIDGELVLDIEKFYQQRELPAVMVIDVFSYYSVEVSFHQFADGVAGQPSVRHYGILNAHVGQFPTFSYAVGCGELLLVSVFVGFIEFLA